MNKEALNEWAAWSFLFILAIFAFIVGGVYLLVIQWLKANKPGISNLKLKAFFISIGVVVLLILFWQVSTAVYQKYFYN